jgi:hypothetical protein
LLTLKLDKWSGHPTHQLLLLLLQVVLVKTALFQRVYIQKQVGPFIHIRSH